MATIVLTGGGSGGHITPLLAVADELKRLRPELRLIYIGQSKDNFGDSVANHHYIDKVYNVQAGKFRRYHKGKLAQLYDFPTIIKNVRDIGRLTIGFVQSLRILKRVKPSVIFIKGGYVGVPVGLAAAVRHIPYVTHDSDALPGLANRIIAPWAAAHAVALPKEAYPNYPSARTFTVGVPIARHFETVTTDLRKKYRTDLGISENSLMLFVTGGGLGAQRLNMAVAHCIKFLFNKYSNLMIIISAGQSNEKELVDYCTHHLSPSEQERIIIKSFIDDLYRYSGAADLIVTRAGATTIAEFASQARPCIMVPNPYLTGGHQLKNAKLLSDKSAVRVVSDDALNDGTSLKSAIVELLDSPKAREELSRNLHGFAHSDAATELAQLLLNTIS
jgi:UDP-N-acetylglucosamine--N-acetylmuramyl-(pentapeptide) pyrophosphoryl-undecaprenol N-acetylglucosamine transferase